MNPCMGILQILFIFIGGFLILNVLIGVIAAVVAEQSDLESTRKKKSKRWIRYSHLSIKMEITK